MTQSTTRETLSEHYKATRARLGDQRTPARPTIPHDRIKPPMTNDTPKEAQVTKHAPRPQVIRRPAPAPITIPPPSPNARRYVHILYDVAVRHNMPVESVVGRSRGVPYVRARQEAFYLLREAGYSLLQIGRFCNRDHTTVMHGAQQHEKRLKGEKI